MFSAHSPNVATQFHRAPRWFVIAALALGAAISLAGTSSGETCGHYVKRLGPGFVPGAAAAAKVAADAKSMAEHSAPAETPCPCHGPECRRGPQEQAPLSPEAPIRILTPQDLLPLVDADAEFTLHGARHFGDMSCRPSRGYPLGMNRPPCV